MAQIQHKFSNAPISYKENIIKIKQNKMKSTAD